VDVDGPNYLENDNVVVANALFWELLELVHDLNRFGAPLTLFDYRG
jgi:hypothetical protein